MNAHTPAIHLPRAVLAAYATASRGGDTQTATCIAASTLKQAHLDRWSASLRFHRQTLEIKP